MSIYKGRGGDDEYHDLYGKMMNAEHESADIPCGCPVEYLWYDCALGIYRCSNCGWCS